MKKVLRSTVIAALFGLGILVPEMPPAFGQTPLTAREPIKQATTCIRLNFHNAPLETVLDYLSEAAGFTIVLEAQVKGSVDVWSGHPVSREDALNLLNSSLIKNGYAAIRDGRTLTIVNRDEAKTRFIPVATGSEPETIPSTDEIATQIIPVRFTEVGRLMKDIQPLVSTGATMTANESANAVVLTDTQTSIHRAAKLIKAIDSGAEDFTVLRIFHLNHADPFETAELLSELFPAENKSANNFSPTQFGAPPGGGDFGGGPPGLGSGDSVSTQTGAASQNTQLLARKANVTAVADARTGSLVVRTSKSLMAQVERVVEKLDASSAGAQRIDVLHLRNAHPQQVAKVLEDLFQKDSATARVSTSQTDPLETRSNTQTQTQSQQSGANSRAGGGGSSGGLGGGSGGSGAPQ